MRKRICICSITFAFFLLICAIFVWYRQPQEYCNMEDAVTMCDGTGEKVIHMTCELYLHRYFLKASEIHGSIYVDGVKYTSIFDLEEYQRWTGGFTDGNGFSAKLSGRKFAVPFINVEYWTGLKEKDLRTDMFFRQETIDDFLVMLAEENIFMITLYGEDKKPTDYFGPAENAAEYDEVMERLEEYWGQI